MANGDTTTKPRKTAVPVTSASPTQDAVTRRLRQGVRQGLDFMITPFAVPKAIGRALTPESQEAEGGVQGATPVSPANPTFQERSRAFGHGLSSGLMETLPVAGAVAGGTVGSGLGLWGAAGGVAGGLIIGDQMKRTLRGHFDTPYADELPQELRPAFYMGEAMGATGGFGPSMFAAVGRRHGARFIDRIIETMERAPRRAVATEAAHGVAAGSAEAVSETLNPGDNAQRVTAGILAGTLIPSPLTLIGIDFGTDLFKRTVAQMSRAGKERTLAVQMRDIIERSGENPEVIASQLRQLDFQGANRTAAQVTGSPILQEWEKELTRRSGDFARESQKRAQDALEIMRSEIAALTASGDPEALRAAAKMKKRYFTGLLQSRVDQAERQALEEARKIEPNSPESLDTLGERARGIVSEALSEARKAEKDIWSKVPTDATLEGGSVIAEAKRVRTEELLPEEGLPDLARRFVKRISQQNTTAKEMLTFRSRMLDEARKANAAKDANTARVYGHLAEAALDDLSGVPGVEDARNFSRTLNDVFTRSFAGEALAKSGTGASRLPPELLTRRAVGTGVELAGRRMQELQRAIRMGNPQASEEFIEIMDNTLRLAASDLVDPQTGQINARQLAKFRQRKAPILEQFPELKEQLKDVQTAREFFSDAVRRRDVAAKAIEEQAAFAKLASGENTVHVVARALTSNRPQAQIKQLARMAKNDSPQAVNGLRSALLEDAFQRAGGMQGRFSFTSFRNALTKPQRAGQKSVMAMMRENGIMDKATQKNLDSILKEAAKVEDSIVASTNLGEITENASALADLVTRVVGSRMVAASGVSQGTGGASIIMAGAGSRFARHALNKVPMDKQIDLMVQAAENPKFLATLLEKPLTAEHKMRLNRRLNLYLWQAGVREPEVIGEQANEVVQSVVDTEIQEQFMDQQ